MSDIKFEIVKKIGVLSKSEKGWVKELNLIRLNDREPKYDIREWSPDGQAMSKVGPWSEIYQVIGDKISRRSPSHALPKSCVE